VPMKMGGGQIRRTVALRDGGAQLLDLLGACIIIKWGVFNYFGLYFFIHPKDDPPDHYARFAA